ncbi:MAG: SBBP repeat-containing protein [Lewinellaceae bacterium]|nr:SBBP repeat-containing protein [Lewinellaceae bacterium]
MENKGQVRGPHGEARPEILFSANGRGCKVFVTATGLSYQFEKIEYPEGYEPRNRHERLGPDAKTRHNTHRVDMRLAGANPNPTIHREQAAAYYENYYNIPEAPEGILGVQAYEKLRFEQVYPGIDWLLYSKGQGLKYDFVVQPGADPALIRMDYSWADKMNLNPDGSLSIVTALGELTEAAPVCFQGDQKIPARFVLDGNTVSIAPEAYDRQQPLVIDPCIVWATYYGGANKDYGKSVALDASGHVYLAGFTGSNSTIATSGGHQTTYGGFTFDAYLVQFDAAGVRQWATYYGGSGFDIGYSVATDAAGHVYLAGKTTSTNNIATPGAHQTSYAGGYNDAFLAQFDASGIRQWATYFGGGGDDYCQAVATDAFGYVYMGGNTSSNSKIAFGGHQNSYGGAGDAFLAKFNTAGVRQWASYYGGNSNEWGNSICTDIFGHVYLVGYSYSTSGIASGGHQNTHMGGSPRGDAFLAQFDTAGVRQWATYYGGPGADDGLAVAADVAGHVFMSGWTNSLTNIAFNGHQSTYNGGTHPLFPHDAYLVQFDTAGVRQWATYYGGPGDDAGYALATDAEGHVYLSGGTGSDSDIAFGGYQDKYGGSYSDGYLVQFDTFGVRQWGLYYGGEGPDYIEAITPDAFGHIYMAGYTQSNTGISAGGHQGTFSGENDAFLAKMYLNNNLNLSETIQPITCKYLKDGSINVDVLNGPPGASYSYAWSNGATNALITGLADQTYTVTVTYGAAGCTVEQSYAVPGPPADIGWSAGLDDVCYNKNNGEIHVSPSGGWGGFTYLWSNGGTDSVIQNLTPGTYTVTITDSGGCSVADVFEVEIEGGGPVSFETTALRINSGEAIEIRMDGMFNANQFAWYIGSQQYANAGQPLSGVWSSSNGAFTRTLSSDNRRYPGQVEIAVAPQYSSTCIGDTVTFTYTVMPNETGIFIPEIYTPNGDGQTDFWTITLPADFQNARVTVYNRAGAKIYEGDATMPWDGSNAPDGTYFYILNYMMAGRQQTLKGAVTILRTN